MVDRIRSSIPSLGTALVLVGILGLVPSAGIANALPATDPQGDSPLIDFDIRGYGFAGDDVIVQVYGKAGNTLPPVESQGYAYVIVTDDGVWAIDSHERQHSTTKQGVDWHAHRVHLGDNPNTPGIEGENCVNEVDEVLHAIVKGDKVTFVDTNITIVDLVLTVELTLQVEDPDNPPEGTPCIALVTDTFDTT